MIFELLETFLVMAMALLFHGDELKMKRRSRAERALIGIRHSGGVISTPSDKAKAPSKRSGRKCRSLPPPNPGKTLIPQLKLKASVDCNYLGISSPTQSVHKHNHHQSKFRSTRKFKEKLVDERGNRQREIRSTINGGRSRDLWWKKLIAGSSSLWLVIKRTQHTKLRSRRISSTNRDKNDFSKVAKSANILMENTRMSSLIFMTQQPNFCAQQPSNKAQQPLNKTQQPKSLALSATERRGNDGPPKPYTKKMNCLTPLDNSAEIHKSTRRKNGLARYRRTGSRRLQDQNTSRFYGDKSSRMKATIRFFYSLLSLNLGEVTIKLQLQVDIIYGFTP